MTGQEHYVEAERLLSTAACVCDDQPFYDADPPNTTQIAAAQVHATLALAAATAQVALDEDRIAGVVDESGTRLRVGAMPV